MTGAGIDEDDAQRIAMNPERAERWLGIDVRNIRVLTPDMVAEHAHEMLSGRRPVPASKRCRLDAVTRALIIHNGANADAVEALTSAARGLGLRDDEDRWAVLRTSVANPEYEVEEAQVDSGILSWNETEGRGTLRVPGIPEAIRIAARGRPLRDLVSHPALDALPLVIADSDGEKLVLTHERRRQVGRGKIPIGP